MNNILFVNSYNSYFVKTMNNINNGHTIVKQWSLNCMLTFNNCITMNDY